MKRGDAGLPARSASFKVNSLAKKHIDHRLSSGAIKEFPARTVDFSGKRAGLTTIQQFDQSDR